MIIMKKLRLLSLLLIAALMLSLALSAIAFAGEAAAPDTESSAEDSESAPAEEEKPEDRMSPETLAILEKYEQVPSDYYAVIWVGNAFQAIPLLREYIGKSFAVRLNDGEYENVIEITRDGFFMREANCPDQLCVGEGEVNAESRDERALMSFIVCLPHQLEAELMSADELADVLYELDKVLNES